MSVASRRGEPGRGRRRVLALAVASAAALSVLAPSPARTQERPPARVEISLDESGPSARLVLTLSRPVPWAIARSGNEIEILYAEPVLVEPRRGKVDGPVVQGWLQDSDRTLRFRLGRGFERYESFELKNPSRLILDFLGRTPVETTTPRPGVRPSEADTVIVIDPGHGGVETGAVGPSGLQEKDLALGLALRLKRVLEQNRGVAVVLTRDDDRLVGLDERTAIANHNRADLFLSIHLNSSRGHDARGAETYYLSAEATDDAARTVAALENHAYRADGAAARKGEGKEALELILWDLAQNQYLAESARLAEAVQRELNLLTGTRDRGVRQAPFRVLMGATMPAILVEAGFISNPDEEALFQQLSYRDRTVEAIARAVDEFLRGRAQLAGPVGGAVLGGGASRP